MQRRVLALVLAAAALGGCTTAQQPATSRPGLAAELHEALERCRAEHHGWNTGIAACFAEARREIEGGGR